MATLALSGEKTARVGITATTACREGWRPVDRPCESGTAHVILMVTDDGSPSLTSYRRVVINVRPGKGTGN